MHILYFNDSFLKNLVMVTLTFIAPVLISISPNISTSPSSAFIVTLPLSSKFQSLKSSRQSQMGSSHQFPPPVIVDHTDRTVIINRHHVIDQIDRIVHIVEHTDHQHQIFTYCVSSTFDLDLQVFITPLTPLCHRPRRRV